MSQDKNINYVQPLHENASNINVWPSKPVFMLNKRDTEQNMFEVAHHFA